MNPPYPPSPPAIKRPSLSQRLSRPLAALVIAVSGGLLWQATSVSAEAGVMVPPLAGEIAKPTANTETAVLAGGCFWGVQAVFQHLKGVTNAVSGYAGGDKSTATYNKVGSGSTGHAEAVSITYDPKQVSYAQILQVYFSVAHNPTELNRQGPDVGTQYRSTIFPASAEQSAIAKRYIEQLDGAKVFKSKIATTIEPMKMFYPAESYHQDFLERNPRHPYIVYNDLPKLEELKRLFPQQYQANAVLVSANTQ